MSTCNQLKCGYKIYGGCRPCKQCNALPNELNDNCDVCYCCSVDEGLLRWDDGDDEIKEEDIKTKQELKPMEIKAK